MKRTDHAEVVAWVVLVTLIVVAFAQLYGCATVPQPTVVSHTEPPPPVVRVPVLVACVEPREIPQPPPTPAIDETLTSWQLAVLVRKKLVEWSQYAARADSLLQGCAKPETKP